jgi:hypothetical protein
MVDLQKVEAIQKLIPLLQNHQAFSQSSFLGERIAEFAERAKIQFCWQGEKVVQQGEQDERFFVLISGELKVVDTNLDPPRLLIYLEPGDIFGMRAILRNSTRAATVEAVNDAVVAAYNREDWDWLINHEPKIGEYFESIERRYDQKAEAAFPGINLQSDELIVVAVKRHFLAYVATLTWPIGILLIPVLFLIGAELLQLDLFNALSNTFTVVLLSPFVIIAFLVALYHLIDWRNDDLIVTTKRVIHMERVLFVGEERQEAPLTQIQNVTVKSHGWLDLVFDVDDIEIKTAAAGTIFVDNVAAAQQISRIILEEQQRAKNRVAAADTASVRRMVFERMQKNVLVETSAKPAAPKVVPPPSLLPKISLPKIKASYLWPSLQEMTTIKNEQGVLWRKHYYILLRVIFLPVLAILVSLYLLVTAFVSLPNYDFLSESGLIQLLAIVTLLGSITWYLWEYDDWRRDVYIVTNTKIIDVESSSFRLKGEQLREGSFDSIQNITYKIPNFFYKLINLGDVIIETAGVGKTFTFIQVLNPSGVQAEIFRRWDGFQQAKREKQRDDTTKQILTVLGEYHDLTNPIKPK